MRGRVAAAVAVAIVAGGLPDTGGTAEVDTDPYALLGVSASATKPDIKKAFRKLALDYHPDRNPSPEAQDKFIQIAAAYELLCDDDRRRAFDLSQKGFDKESKPTDWGRSSTPGGGSNGRGKSFHEDAAEATREWHSRFFAEYDSHFKAHFESVKQAHRDFGGQAAAAHEKAMRRHMEAVRRMTEHTHAIHRRHASALDVESLFMDVDGFDMGPAAEAFQFRGSRSKAGATTPAEEHCTITTKKVGNTVTTHKECSSPII